MLACLCIAQQVPIYSQYVLNEFLINPSVAGIDGMTTINFSGRKQWFGLKYTPETYSASISTRILKSSVDVSDNKIHKGSRGRVGLGAAFISDKNGAICRTSFQFTYAYHIFIHNYQLSFGLKGIATQLKIDEDRINFREPDPEMENLIGKSAFIPDAGAGISISSRYSQIGLSVTQLLEAAIKFGDFELETENLKQMRQYTLYGYYRIPVQHTEWDIEPSMILRGNEQLRFSADLTTRFIYRKEYWAGLSYRTSRELVLLLGLKMNRFFVGYSFDYGFTQLSYKSYGSHEVVLAYKYGDSLRRYKWLERY